jgi:hypothetical protein
LSAILKFVGRILTLVTCILFFASDALAIKTASSFDLSYGMAGYTIKALDGNGEIAETRTLSSKTGFQIDYNVALFDYRTVATISFSQFQTSNVGDVPLTRLAIGGSYHFIRVNGQRLILDSEVESKVWGISPAVELTFGINKLSINDTEDFQFTSSLFDMTPKLSVEIPISSKILLILKGGYFLTLFSSSSPFKINLSGSLFNLGLKLTTL